VTGTILATAVHFGLMIPARDDDVPIAPHRVLCTVLHLDFLNAPGVHKVSHD